MRIKICGLTNLADTLAALDAGADYLGFNFYPRSPRYIPPPVCAQIQTAVVKHRSAVISVGIFVNATAAQMLRILGDCGLHLAQLHGAEPPELLTALAGRAYKAFRGLGDDHAAYAAAGPGAPAFLVDAYSPTAYGGTGQTVDWPAARRLAAQYPLFLAGGLTPANVAAAIEQASPWGVDVASGVEASPGQKDHAKMRDFVAAARAA